jgi:hypothetical protein
MQGLMAAHDPEAAAAALYGAVHEHTARTTNDTRPPTPAPGWTLTSDIELVLYQPGG